MVQHINSIHHNATNYGSAFVTGRGNRTSVTRWDATAPTNSSLAITSSTKYNTAGSPVAQVSPWDGTNTRTVRIGYADNFNSSPGVTTYAYPTVISDPAASSLGDASHSSTVKYRYDIGANFEATSPAPAGQSHGKTTKRIFDSIGRLDKQSVYVNTTEQSYTRYEYPTSGIHSKAYSTIVDTNSNGPDTADEVLSESWSDGAGRVRFSRVPHTFSGGSTATWAGTAVEYDMLGRVTRQSVPTEVNDSFEPTGDDVSRGWLWNRQEYDWMGRTTRTIPTDSNGTDGKDTITSYEGCGCAGGLVTTVQGPLVPRDDDPETNARRTVKSYADILGRAFKTETYEWNGSTVYSSVLNTFNGRDQVTLSRQFAGTTSSTTYQDTTASYDGFGRKVGQKLPQQDSPGTAFTYNPDGSVLTQTDARGVVTNFEYNNRGLTTGISWDVGSTGVTDTPDVEIEYDNLGNRTEMTDGLGTQVYEYDALSRLTAETRSFADTLTNAPLPNNSFRLEYSYHLSGQLKTLTDPYAYVLNYSRDRTGRVNSVYGSINHAGVNQYLNDISYRAWGSMKQSTNGNGVTQSTSFNHRLQPENYQLGDNVNGIVSNKDHYYNNDGNLSFVNDEMNETFDRLNRYDHQGRLVSARSGIEANGGTAEYPQDIPYRQNYGFDAFGNNTALSNVHWGQEADPAFDISFSRQLSFQNGRITNAGYVYDADGRMLIRPVEDFPAEHVYDASGRIIDREEMYSDIDTQHAYNGDGLELKRIANNETPLGSQETKTYYVRSSVLGGQTVTEWSRAFVISPEKIRYKSYVHVDDQVVAWRSYAFGPNGAEAMRFEHRDPLGLSYKASMPGGGVVSQWNRRVEGTPTEFDPTGTSVGLMNPYESPPPLEIPDAVFRNIFSDSEMFVNGQKIECLQDGALGSCSTGFRLLANGAARLDQTDANLATVRRHNLGNWFDRDDPRSWGGVISEFIPNNLWAPQQQRGTTVRFRDLADARSALEQTLNGKCGEMVEKLFAELRQTDEETARLGYDNPRRNGSVLNIFDELAAQEVGGFTFDKELYGAAGQAEAEPIGGKWGNGAYMHISIAPHPASFLHKTSRNRNKLISGREQSELIARKRASLIGTLIHEIAHAAGTNYTFSHTALDNAAKAVDSDLAKEKLDAKGEDKSMYFNRFLEKHCGLKQDFY